MGIFGKLFKPGGDTIKGTLEGAGSFAKDLRQAIKNDIPADKQADLIVKTIEVEAQIKKAQAEVIMAEARGGSWLQRSWRPITMLWFVALISLSYFGLVPESITEEIQLQLMELVKLGLTGYIVGRSAEKVATTWNQP